MIRNIYGNSASPLQGEVGGSASAPTLRIGLMSVAPAERFMRSMTKALVLIVVAMFLCSCSTRVVSEPFLANNPSPNAININTATVVELERLPGVGRKTAEAIVDHRERHGTFRRVEHLMLIHGVSEARFAGIRPLVRIE